MKVDSDHAGDMVRAAELNVPPAEEIHFTEVKLRKRSGNALSVIFNLTWSGSWRWAGGNWDAAWVFFKYSTDPPYQWAPVRISKRAESFAPPKATVMPAEDGMGAFIYRSRSHTGYGPADFKTVELPLRRKDLKIDPCETLVLAICGVRMVYIPEGPFWAGDPDGPNGPKNCFYDPSAPKGGNRAYCVDSEDPIKVGSGKSGKRLYYQNTTLFGGDRKGKIPAKFPKGHDAFYVMRSQVTQGDYAQFLNLVDDPYTIGLRYQWGAGSYRFTIWSTQINPSIATRPRRPCNWLSWADGTAYACWAGLRPITELEYEKACRGSDDPVAGEFAWGDSGCEVVNVILGDESTGQELASGNCNVDNDNVEFHGGDGGSGPLRADAFLGWRSPFAEMFYMGHRDNVVVDRADHLEPAIVTGDDLRQWTGASYYGVMGLSGNLWELCVTVGTPEGRSFTGKHGKGKLRDGAAPAGKLKWPRNNGRGNGYRGGSWYTGRHKAVMADRSDAAGWPNYVYRTLDFGFRCARTAPAT